MKRIVNFSFDHLPLPLQAAEPPAAPTQPAQATYRAPLPRARRPSIAATGEEERRQTCWTRATRPS
jgi:hypothetical protein